MFNFANMGFRLPFDATLFDGGNVLDPSGRKPSGRKPTSLCSFDRCGFPVLADKKNFIGGRIILISMNGDFDAA